MHTHTQDAGLQKKQSFISPIIWDRPTFTQRYPAFVEWQAARAAAAVAPNGLPLRRPRLTAVPVADVDAEEEVQAGAAEAWLVAEPAGPAPQAEGTVDARGLGQGWDEEGGERWDSSGASGRSAAGTSTSAAAPKATSGSAGSPATSTSAAVTSSSAAGAAAPKPEGAQPGAGASLPPASNALTTGAGVSVATAMSRQSARPAAADDRSSSASSSAAQPGSGRASSTKLATKPVRGAGGRGAGAAPAAGPPVPALRAIPRRQQVIRMPSAGSSVDEEPL